MPGEPIFDDASLDRLATLVSARLAEREPRRAGTSPAAYTTATLANELGISARAVRAAIERGHLDARRTGGRWIIAAEAVSRWARPDDRSSNARRPGSQRSVRPLSAALARVDPTA